MKTEIRTCPAGRPRPGAVCAALLALLVGLSACTTPVGTTQVPARQAYRELNRSALNSSQPSNASQRVLHRFDLVRDYAGRPAWVLDQLLSRAMVDDRRDILFALAELACLHADKLRESVKPGASRQAPDYYLLSAVVSFHYLFGEGSDPQPSPYERQFREACDLYARALTQAFTDPTDPAGSVRLTAGRRSLPGGELEVTLAPGCFPYPLADFAEFIPANSLRIRGISVHNTESGLGTPLVGRFREGNGANFRVTVPATLLGRFQGNLRSLRAGGASLALELYSPYHTSTVAIAGRGVPLAADLTAAMAFALDDTRIWRLGLNQFLQPVERVQTGIYHFQPCQPGRIPVVFIHGTMSSPVYWVEMMNSLYADRRLRERYQFWFFIYNSGNPIGYSAAKLRRTLQEQVQQLDPEGRDPALRQMVLIGHSQGGLLAKLAVTETGDTLWRQVCDRDFDTLPLPPEQKELLRQSYFFTPLPFVRRVVLVATPHRGSYLLTALVRRLVCRFIRLPEQLIHATAAFTQAGAAQRLAGRLERQVPTALDNLSPRNRWLAALAQCPIGTNVTAHSIIALKGRQRPPAGGDGVVRYTSAHVAEASSEFIVRSGHTCQNKPATIEEVRRILLEHARSCPAPEPAREPAGSAAIPNTTLKARTDSSL